MPVGYFSQATEIGHCRRQDAGLDGPLTLERKITEWKLQVEEHKHQILTVKETSEQKKNALKKATRAQKQRAERFEAAVESLTSKIREREVRLSETLSASSVWKSHHEKVVEEKTNLEVQIDTLKKQISNLLEELKKIQDCGRNSNKENLTKLNFVNSENEDIRLENAELKTSLATLEDNTISAEVELLDLQAKAKQQENLIQQYKTEVSKKLEYNSNNNHLMFLHLLCFYAAMQVRDQMEVRLKELEHVRDLQRAAEQKLQTCQEKLLSYKGTYADKSKAIRELQVQIENNNSFLRNHSLEDENCNIQTKYEKLQRKLEEMEVQNAELTHHLENQEVSLQRSESQLKQKLAEYEALTRQLEAALEEGRKKVSEEVGKMSSKEQALQLKILDLETELRERKEEQKKLASSFKAQRKHHEFSLKELEHSLQKSENQNQSIQNYVQFLKTTYVAMFGLKSLI
uniref:Outer dense fiber of sperm tails 2 like n=1 Tax=Sphenodon punctatus TaxID=8508 RepID=A0A8D0HMN8_SPHPU